MNIYGVMNTAKNALAASQTAIGVTGNNIANINDPNYSQQVTVLSPGPVQDYGGFSIGTGVSVTAVTRNFDGFLFNQSVDANSNESLWNMKSQLMNQVNSVLNDTSGTGIGNAISSYFQSWQTLATNPTGVTERQAVVSTANTLTDDISKAASQLVAMQGNSNTDIANAIPQLNVYTSQIAGLNKLIHETEVGTNKANDYRDQRDALIQKVSTLVGVSYFEQSNGEDILMLKNGSPLVDGQSNYPLSSALNPANPRVTSVYWNAPSGTQVDVTNQITGGQMGAWLQTRDKDVQSVLDHLDTLAGSIVATVNNLHNTGYGLDGSTGNNFFNAITPGGTGLLSNTGNGVITGKLLNPANVSLDHYNLAYDGTSYAITNTDQGGVTQLAGANIASVQNFFQQRGYSINLTGTPMAGDSFNISAVNNAATLMSVSTSVQNDRNKVAAGTTTQGADGTLAQQMGLMVNQTVIGGPWSANGTVGTNGLYTFGDFYSSAIGAMATSAQNATSSSTIAQNTLTQTNNLMQQISGVNMDEQMINLVQYQNSYQAAAKALTTADQMLQSLFSIQ